VAALPHHSGSRSGVLEDVLGGSEIGSAFRVEFWLEVVACHERSFQKRENIKEMFRNGENSRCVGQIVDFSEA
jgi:hypothetical protein